jgi:hypothetical protein
MDARRGRFLSEDPVWHENLYPFADNNPLKFADPEGTTYVSNEDLALFNDLVNVNNGIFSVGNHSAIESLGVLKYGWKKSLINSVQKGTRIGSSIVDITDVLFKSFGPEYADKAGDRNELIMPYLGESIAKNRKEVKKLIGLFKASPNNKKGIIRYEIKKRIQNIKNIERFYEENIAK